MQILGLLGAAAFSLASAVVGIRLLRLAARTRQAPEFAMGLAFVVSGAIGFPLLTAAGFLLAAGAPELARFATGLGLFSLFAGYVGLSIGCWRIYRPTARWPRLPIAAGTLLLLLAAIAVTFVTDDRRPGGPRDVAIWSGIGMGILAFGWNAVESFSLHRQLRRRLAVGLAEPEIVNRILMWGIGSSAACAMTFYSVAARLLVGQIPGDGHRLVSSGFGLIAAVAIGLAFFPPAAYRRRFAAPLARDGSL
ncbi:hypothetical protein KJ059_02905 [Myxococcota bacterium]|nr:hypothetical protein [Myxococcota bacterium]MCZ7618258.1 hypothetical protein [Myxococcota bacterium]